MEKTLFEETREKIEKAFPGKKVSDISLLRLVCDTMQAWMEGAIKETEKRWERK